MTTIPSTTSAVPKKRRIVLWGIALSIVFAATLLSWVIALNGFDLSPKKLTLTESCGDYRLFYYLRENGSGHVDFADKRGKIYGTFKLASNTETSPIWDSDCKGVIVGIGDNSKHFKVTKMNAPAASSGVSTP